VRVATLILSVATLVAAGLFLSSAGQPPAANASPLSSTSVSSGVLDFTAGSGQNNNITVSLASGTYTIADSAATITAGSGCTQAGSSQVTCSASGVTSIHVAGQDGDDILNSSSATPATVDGGTGDDKILGGSGNDSLIGGNGTDTADYSNATSAVTASLATTAAQNTGGAGTDTISSSVENLAGSAYNDTLSGNDSANILTGGAGNDSIRPRIGTDTINGGAGTDTVDYSDRTTTDVTVSLDGAANDGDPALNGGAGENDTVSTDVENILGGLANDTLIGDSGANTLSGSNGLDTLIGGPGDDTLSGGNDTDTADYSTAGAAVTASLATAAAQNTGAAGTDTITASVENLTGSAYDDTLSGNDSANILTGGAGNDSIRPRLGRDSILGGSGSDTVDYSERTADVTVTLDGAANDGDPTQSGGAGELDTVNTDVENILGGLGNDSLTGSSGANVLTGSGGNDAITGGAGADTVSGDDGNDTLALKDGFMDSGACGSGSDSVAVDAEDGVASDCESIARAVNTAITAGPAEASSTGSPQSDFVFGSDPGTSFECKLDAGSWTPCASPYRTNWLRNGAHSLSVRAVDVNGEPDLSPATRNFNVASDEEILSPDDQPPIRMTGFTSDPTHIGPEQRVQVTVHLNRVLMSNEHVVVTLDGVQIGDCHAWGYTFCVVEGYSSWAMNDGHSILNFAATLHGGEGGTLSTSVPVDRKEWTVGFTSNQDSFDSPGALLLSAGVSGGGSLPMTPFSLVIRDAESGDVLASCNNWPGACDFTIFLDWDDFVDGGELDYTASVEGDEDVFSNVASVSVTLVKPSFDVTLQIGQHSTSDPENTLAAVALSNPGVAGTPFQLEIRNDDDGVVASCSGSPGTSCGATLGDGEYFAAVVSPSGKVISRSESWEIEDGSAFPADAIGVDLVALARSYDLRTADLCDDLLTAPGTNVEEASVTDQYLICEEGEQAGWSTLKILRLIAAGAGADTIYHLYKRMQDRPPIHWGQPHDDDQTHPNSEPPPRLPAPVTPGPRPGNFEDLVDVLMDKNTQLQGKRRLASQSLDECRKVAARAFLTEESCVNTPIFFVNAREFPNATTLEREAQIWNPLWGVVRVWRSGHVGGRKWYSKAAYEADCGTEARKAFPVPQCHEFPYYTMKEGGEMSSPRPKIRIIPGTENMREGRAWQGFINTQCHLSEATTVIYVPTTVSSPVPTAGLCNGAG
jgi:Ca2+-binding RTX toxin-like protein